MRELSAEGSTATADNDETSPENVRALKAVWEEMLIKGMDGDPGVEQSSGDSGFQDKIKQAVNKLKESESNLQVDSFLHLYFSFTYKKYRLMANLRILNHLKLS